MENCHVRHCYPPQFWYFSRIINGMHAGFSNYISASFGEDLRYKWRKENRRLEMNLGVHHLCVGQTCTF